MTVVHLVSKWVLPFPGGLQESVMRIGGSLAEAGFRVVVYSLDQPVDYRFTAAGRRDVTVVHLDDRDLLLEPYREEGRSDLLATETSRASALLLRNTVDRQRESAPGARHLIISFFASGTGFLAQMTATALRLPHICAVRGSDFSRDIYGVAQLPRLRAAVEGSNLVVTANREQADSLSAVFSCRQPIRTIHSALLQNGDRPLWESPPADRIRLISDCGLSGRKGTQILLRAAAALMDRNLPVSLTLLGGVFWRDSRGYWEQLKRSYESRYPGKFSFPGHVSKDQLDAHLRASHIYCSASLAEGCSMSHVRALTLGIPMVTTATGVLPELAMDCRHVRLCRAGEWGVLADALEGAVAESRAGTLQPERARVEDWRRHFSVERERDEWVTAIDVALNHCPHSKPASQGS